MPIDASDRTLGLINIWQVLRKLYWEVELLKAIPRQIRVGEVPVDILHLQDARIYAAINAASTNIALVDWLYHSIREHPELLTRTQAMLDGVVVSSDKAFLLSLRKLNKSLNACHQICNANKHFHLNSPEREFKIMVGEMAMRNADGSTDISVFMHVTWNGAGVDGQGSIDDMLDALLVWWEATLSQLQIPSREQFFPSGSQ